VALGDVGAAAIVFVGTTWLSLDPRGFAAVMGSSSRWLLLGLAQRSYRDLSASGQTLVTSGVMALRAARVLRA
jgi:hypothetical protein